MRRNSLRRDMRVFFSGPFTWLTKVKVQREGDGISREKIPKKIPEIFSHSFFKSDNNVYNNNVYNYVSKINSCTRFNK